VSGVDAVYRAEGSVIEDACLAYAKDYSEENFLIRIDELLQPEFNTKKFHISKKS